MVNKLENINSLLDTFFMYRKEAVKSKTMFYLSYFVMLVYVGLSISVFYILNTSNFSVMLKIIVSIVFCLGFCVGFLVLKERIKHNKIMLKIYREKLSEMFGLVFDMRKYLSDEDEKDLMALKNIDLKLFLVNPNV